MIVQVEPWKLDRVWLIQNQQRNHTIHAQMRRSSVSHTLKQKKILLCMDRWSTAVIAEGLRMITWHLWHENFLIVKSVIEWVFHSSHFSAWFWWGKTPPIIAVYCRLTLRESESRCNGWDEMESVQKGLNDIRGKMVYSNGALGCGCFVSLFLTFRANFRCRVDVAIRAGVEILSYLRHLLKELKIASSN